MSIIPVQPMVSQYLHNKASRAGIPLSGTFELTPVCNMNCKMCYVRMSRQEQEAIRPLKTAEQWLELAHRAKEAGMVYLLLTGGEPFLHPQFREILTGLHQMGFVISVNSNGTLIDADTVQWLKTVPPTRINITLYGASDETYGRLCGNPRGFTQTTNAIRLLREAGLTVKLNCSVTPHNVQDLPDIIAYGEENHLVVQASTYMFPPVRKDPGMVGINDRFSPEEAAYRTAQLEYLLNGREAFLARPEDELPALPVEGDEDCSQPGEQIRCRAGKCSFWITWEGRMLPCGMFPSETGGNVFENDFGKLWEAVRKQTSEIRLPAKCAGCNLKDTCRACAAMVLTETGGFDQAPAYRCAMTYSFASQRKKFREELLRERDPSLAE